SSLGRPQVSDLTDHLSRYFKGSRRRSGESVNDYISRKSEIYLRACQALQRVSPLQKVRTTPTTSATTWTPTWSRRSSYDAGDNEAEEENNTGGNAGGNAAPEQGQWWEDQRSNWSGGWSSSWWGSQWSWSSYQDYGDYEREAAVPELLPDYVQGWYLLHDSGLSGHERNVVQTALQGDFSVARVAQELRNQCAVLDSQRRDFGNRGSSYLGDIQENEAEENATMDDSFLGDLPDEEMEAWETAENEDKLRKLIVDAAETSAKAAEQVEATSSFICYNDVLEDQSAMATEVEAAFMQGVSTAEAVAQGKAVIDGGATRTLASCAAMEAIMALNAKKNGHNGLLKLDKQDCPTFGFGNGESNKCTATVQLAIRADEKPGALTVHCLDQGGGPLLLSVEALRRLKAVIDFSEDLVCFRALDVEKLIPLERSQTGHQLLPVTEDLYKHSLNTKSVIPSLRDYVQQSI
ncbi:unnamed protein product, partial [Symbiodinium sp. CCMP2456]